jgi:hypothetical protein
VVQVLDEVDQPARVEEDVLHRLVVRSLVAQRDRQALVEKAISWQPPVQRLVGVVHDSVKITGRPRRPASSRSRPVSAPCWSGSGTVLT